MAKIRNPVLESWFEQALKLKLGEELFIACEDRKDRAKMVKDLDAIAKSYINIEPVITNQLIFRSVFRDGGHWIRVVRKPSNPKVIFKKLPDGSVSKENLTIDYDKKRMIELMIRDGWTSEYIKEHFWYMTEEELKPYLKGVILN